MSKPFLSLVGSVDASDLRAVEAGEVKYALENSMTFPALVWTTLAGPPPGSAAAAAATAAVKPAAAAPVKVTDAELEEIVILGKDGRSVLVSNNQGFEVVLSGYFHPFFGSGFREHCNYCQLITVFL